MPQTIYFISHPNVIISASVPVTQWPLSNIGKQRMQTLCTKPWVSSIASVYCSAEQKAIDGADILAKHLKLEPIVEPKLGENDRSATGYLEAEEFEKMADRFFQSPEKSIRGWESAMAAQQRIVGAVSNIGSINRELPGNIAIVSHGAVGTLLYCSLANCPIDRQWDQPGQGGGNYFELCLQPEPKVTWWESIDDSS